MAPSATSRGTSVIDGVTATGSRSQSESLTMTMRVSPWTPDPLGAAGDSRADRPNSAMNPSGSSSVPTMKPRRLTVRT